MENIKVNTGLYKRIILSALKTYIVSSLIIALIILAFGFMVWIVLALKTLLMYPLVVILITSILFMHFFIGYQYFLISRYQNEYFVLFIGLIKKPYRIKLSSLVKIRNGGASSIFFQFHDHRSAYLTFYNNKVGTKIKMLKRFVNDKYNLSIDTKGLA